MGKNYMNKKFSWPKNQFFLDIRVNFQISFNIGLLKKYFFHFSKIYKQNLIGKIMIDDSRTIFFSSKIIGLWFIPGLEL